MPSHDEGAPSVSISQLQELLRNHERAHVGRGSRGAPEDPDAYRRVAIVGGGTAGYLTALALRARAPWIDVTLIESSRIPIIGVGEASVPHIVAFLHRYLDIDVHAFQAAVSPTWKQGIRFEWGKPGEYSFQTPFDWDASGVGIVGSLAAQGDINSMSLGAILMVRNLTPILRDPGGRVISLLDVVPFAYHLDNQRLVAFLRATALARGVTHLDRAIVDAALDARGEEVDHLITADGERLAFDLYIDCSGFRSLLLGDKLGSPYTSFASSLFTDGAVAFNAPHGGRIKPYTTARTMDCGWCWNIPMVEDDHLGYVFSSAFCTADEAAAEAKRVFPGMGEARLVKFRSGRHAEMWKGNVVGIGNAYGFVEPLESTGLLMICREIIALVDALPAGRRAGAIKARINERVGRTWDRLRWFLAVHYRFNHRLDTPFWQAARSATDVSGIQDAIDLFEEGGPLRLRSRDIRDGFAAGVVFGVAGFDCIMMGQGVPARLPDVDGDRQSWHRRHASALGLAHYALPQREALAALRERPDILDALINEPNGWVEGYARDW